MRLTVGDSTLRTFQNCSPSRARLVNDLLDSATKNSDRLSNLGCSRTMSDIIVEPQRPVLTMKTGDSMQIPRRSSRRTRLFGIQFRENWYSPIGESITFAGSALIEPRHHILGRGKNGARGQVEGWCRPAHQD